VEKIDFQPEHGQEITSGSVAQEISHLNMSRQTWEQIDRNGRGFTGMHNGEVRVCSGILPLWPGRWALWCVVSSKVGPSQMLWIHRRALEWLDRLQVSGPKEFCRIEATACIDHLQAMKWLEMLGFWEEGTLRCYDAAGNDHVQYARISCHLTPHR
jgi:hypothetical protein